LGFLRMNGTTLRSPKYIPSALLRHVGHQFVEKAPDLFGLRIQGCRGQTRYEIQGREQDTR
jgi:hypothetical protein